MFIMGSSYYTDPDLTSAISYFEFTVAHEAVHMWFYSLVGNNQYDDAFIDEGLTNYLSGDVYFRIMREDGVLWADLGEAAPVMVSSWHLLKLTPRDARELQGELRALHERYARRAGEEPFLLGIFLADTSNVPGLEYARGDKGDA